MLTWILGLAGNRPRLRTCRNTFGTMFGLLFGLFLATLSDSLALFCCACWRAAAFYDLGDEAAGQYIYSSTNHFDAYLDSLGALTL